MKIQGTWTNHFILLTWLIVTIPGESISESPLDNNSSINDEPSPSFLCKVEEQGSLVGIVEGTFLNLSQVLNRPCFEQGVMGQLTLLNILVRQTVTIDTDWPGPTLQLPSESETETKAKSMSLVIIAPRWIIHGHRTIDLSGAPGRSYKGSPTAGQNSQGDGFNGADGVAGQDAGDFFGVGQYFLGTSSSSWSLRIQANGGDGGSGQDGGHGSDGQDGVPIEDSKISGTDQTGLYSPYKTEKQYWSCAYINAGMPCFIYKVTPSTFGKRGRDGGNGGAGAPGGLPGDILLLRLETTGAGENKEDGHVSTSQSPGRPGDPGLGGRGGAGTPTRKFVYYTTSETYLGLNIGTMRTEDFCTIKKRLADYTVHMHQCLKIYGTDAAAERRSNPGKNGTLPRPSPPTNFDLYRHQKYVNEYLKWSRNGILGLYKQILLLPQQRRSQNEREFVEMLGDQSEFYKILTENPQILDLYDIHGLTQTFKDLEVNYFFQKDDPSFLHLTQLSLDAGGWWGYSNFYSSFLHSLSRFIERIPEEIPEEQYKDINSLSRLLVMATNGRIIGINYPTLSETHLVTDINGFLALTQKNLRAYLETQEKQKGLAAIQKEEANYRADIDQKFMEASNLIFNEVNVEIAKTEASFKIHIEKLTREIDALVRVEEDAIEKLEKARALMEERQILGGFFGLVKLGGQALSMAGPVGQSVGAGIGTATSLVESAALGSSDPMANLPQNYPLPPSLQVAQTLWVEQLSLDTYQQVLTFSRDMDKSLDILSTIKKETTNESLSEAVFEVEKKIEETRDTLEDMLEFSNDLDDPEPGQSRNRRDLGPQSCSACNACAKNKMREKLAAKKYIRESKQEIREIVEKELAQLEKQQRTDQRWIKGMLKFQQVTQIVGGVRNLVQQQQAADDSIAQINAQIDARNAKIARLGEQQIKIENKLRPLLIDGLEAQFGVDSDFRTGLSTSSSISLVVSSMKVQGLLRDIKLIIKKEFTEGFQIHEFLARAVEKLEEGLVTLINIYDKLQGYEEQSKMASFISGVASRSLLFTPSSSFGSNIGDWNLRKTVQDLQLTVQSTVILTRYEKVLHAFKMWVFPFAHLYLGKFALPPQLMMMYDDGNMTSPENDEVKIQSLVEHVMERVEGMIEVKQNHDVSVVGYDEFIQDSHFYKSPSRMPFFAWRHEDGDGPMIEQLLAGQVVRGKADIRFSGEKVDAIKFTEIGIHLYSRNETVAVELEEILQHYQMSLRHLGDSRYRFNGTTYVMWTEPLKPWRLSFERSHVKGSSILTDGIPVTKNKVYEKVARGDVMLSPYATWEMLITRTLSSSHNQKQEDLNESEQQTKKNELLRFFPHVEIHLVGRGVYISDHGLTTPFPKVDLHLDKHYVKDDSIVFKRIRRRVGGKIRDQPGDFDFGSDPENRADGQNEATESWAMSPLGIGILTILVMVSLSLLCLYVWRRVWKNEEGRGNFSALPVTNIPLGVIHVQSDNQSI